MRHIRKREVVILLTMSIVLVILGNVFSVFAATSSELKNQQQNNQKQIDEAKDEQEKIKSQMSSIQKEVENLNATIASYENEIDDLTDQIDETASKIDEMTQELDNKQKELEEKEKLLEKRLVATYKAGDTSYLDLLLSSGSLTDFLSNYYLIEQLNDSDSKLIDTIKATKAQIEESKTQLEESKVQLEDARELQKNKKAALDISKSEKTQKVAQLSSEEQDLQKKIEDMQAQDTVIREAIKKAEAAEREANRNNGGNSPSKNPGGYIYPVPSAYAKITTGMYYSSGSYHGAVDFGTGGIAGQPVYAVKSGTVVLTQALTTSYGNYIIINHHDGTYTLYAHGQAGSICVSPGQTVSQGQQIMKVGSTGNSSGAHLHFEVRVSPGGYNNRVNPLSYLP